MSNVCSPIAQCSENANLLLFRKIRALTKNILRLYVATTSHRATDTSISLIGQIPVYA